MNYLHTNHYSRFSTHFIPVLISDCLGASGSLYLIDMSEAAGTDGEREEQMSIPLPMDSHAERAIQEFELDLKQYQAASRRSLLGLLAFLGLVSMSCLACGGLIYFAR